MNRIIIILLLFSSLFVMCEPTFAYDPSPDQVEKWFRSEWEKTQGEPNQFYGMIFRWQQSTINISTSSQNSNSSISTKSTFELHILNDHSWRINQDINSEDYWDVVVTPNVQWGMTPKHLAIVDPDHINASSYNYPQLQTEFLDAFDAFAYSDLGDIPSVSDAELSSKVSGSKFKIRITYAKLSFYIELSGHWDDSEDRGFTDALIFKSTSAKNNNERRVSFANWNKEPALGLWIAHEVIDRDISDDADDTIHLTLLSCSKENPTTFSELTNIPSPEIGHDPLRGDTTYEQVEDFRNGDLLNRVQNTDSFNRLKGILPTGTATPVRLRWLGWLAAAGIIVALFILRIRKGS